MRTRAAVPILAILAALCMGAARDIVYKPAVGAAGAAGIYQRHRMGEVRRLIRGRLIQARVAGAADLQQVCDELVASGAAEWAKPDRLIPVAETIPNDPQFGGQWWLQKINAPAAWDYAHESDVIIGLCDTGVDADHPDLAMKDKKGNVIRTNLVPGINIVNGSADTSDVAGHGTATAGVIAAIGNNGIGVSGVCWTAKVMPIRVTNRSDTMAYWTDLIASIGWAADHGCRVISMSYQVAREREIMDAAREAYLDHGTLFVYAMGNNSQWIMVSSNWWEAGYGALGVIATDEDDEKTWFSTYGVTAEISAPGQDVLTTAQGGGYASVDGTSFSAPMVAGTAALIWSLAPDLTAYNVGNLMIDTADDVGPLVGWDPQTGWGRLNMAAALSALGTPPPPAPQLHIADALVFRRTWSWGTYVRVYLQVADGDGTPVDGALVRLHWGGTADVNAEMVSMATPNSTDGCVWFTIGPLWGPGQLIWEVNSVFCNGYEYDPSADAVTGGSEWIDVPGTGE